MKRIQPQEVQQAFSDLTEGKSLRAIARGLGCDHKSIRERIIRQYGSALYQAALNRQGLSSLAKDAIKNLPSRHRKAAEDWLESHKQQLLELDAKFPAETKLYSDREIAFQQRRTAQLFDRDIAV